MADKIEKKEEAAQKPKEDGVTIKLPALPKLSRPKVFLIGFVLGALVLFGVLYRVFNIGIQSANVSAGAAPSVIFARVQKQDKLVVASQDYTIVDKVADSNKIPFTDISIIGTENKFWYRYSGTLEVAVDLQNAVCDQTGEKSLTITLDQPFISSNTPDMDVSGVLEETNNLLNPIHVEDVDAFQRECIERSEAEAKEGDLLDEARSNAESDLSRLFQIALGEDFEVSIAWRDATE